MGYLGVEDPTAIDSVRIDKRRAILAEIVKNLDYICRCKDLLQVVFEPMVERVNL